MNNKKYFLGILYFLVHFIVEITSFYVLTSYVDGEIVIILALVYDFLAFVPQGLFGYLKDKGLKINFSIVGVVLTSISVLMFYFNLNAILIIVILAIGVTAVHIEGAETTLRSSDGKMFPSALFVAGGSFGVVIGKLMAQNGFPILPVIAINLIILPLALIARVEFNPKESEGNLNSFNFSSKRFDASTIVLLAVIVVAARAYMGYGIPTAWNKTATQTVLLYVFMGAGKALGGLFIDLIGIRKTALISTIGALPFLLFGDNVMIVSLIGIMLFSMTMAITLAVIVSEMPKLPGVAFGMTTIGLFVGTLPIFFFKITTVWVNCLVITLLTVACVIILNMICKKEEKITCH